MTSFASNGWTTSSTKMVEVVQKIESKEIFSYVGAFWTMYFECLKDTFNFLDNVGANL